ncbi:MAG: hypothetical protein WDN09_01170 [bacterium]
MRNRQEGFIALVTVLILMTVLMMLMFANNTSSYFARFDALGSENKRISLGLSESCSNAALLRLAQNYDYAGSETINVGDDACYIEHISSAKNYDIYGTEISKTATINTKAQHPSVNGSWSTNSIVATIKDPTYTTTAIAPTCTLTLDKSGTINSGQSLTATWTVSNSPTSFTIRGITNAAPNPIPSDGDPSGGSKTFHPTESTTYVGLVTGANGLQGQCVVSISVKPSIGECANTVMMLDRTASMNDEAIADEKAAAESLLDLYNELGIPPLTGIGRFGKDSKTSAEIIPAIGSIPEASMTSSYGEKSAPGSLGPYAPSNASAGWTNPNNGRAHESPAALYATSTTSGQKQNYYNFGFNTNSSNTIPSSATIQGIEVTIDGKIAGTASQDSAKTYPTSTGNFNSWTANNANNCRSTPTNTKGTTCVNGTDASDNTYLVAPAPTPTPTQATQTFMLPNMSIPQGSKINSVAFFAVVKNGSAGTSNVKLVLENSTGPGHQWLDSGHALSSTMYTTIQYNNTPTNINPSTGIAWTIDDVNTWAGNGKLRFGIQRTNTNSVAPRVTQIYAIVNYYSPSINVDLSWNNGANGTYTTGSGTGVKTVVLTATDPGTGVILGGATDLWDEPGWDDFDFDNGSFLVRLTNNAATGNTLSIDYVKVKVYYTGPSGLYASIKEGLDNSIGSYTNLGDAIKYGATELGTVNDGKKKVLILISDGTNVNLDSSNATGSTNTTQSAINWAKTEATNAKNGSGGLPQTEIYTIHFGSTASDGTYNPSPRNFIAGLATSSANDKATAALENSDDDHFFIAPSSSDMQKVFNTIGKLACPALTNPGSPEPIPDPPSPPPPPPPVSIGSWDEVITP